MPISGVEEADKGRLLARTPTRPSRRLSVRHSRTVTSAPDNGLCRCKQSTDKGSMHMRQAWRGIAGLLAVGALTAGGSVALADNGGGHGNGNGNRGNALATTIFTMPA